MKKDIIDGLEHFRPAFKEYSIPDNAIEVTKEEFILFLEKVPYKRDRGHSVRVYYIPAGKGYFSSGRQCYYPEIENGTQVGWEIMGKGEYHKFFIDKKQIGE